MEGGNERRAKVKRSEGGIIHSSLCWSVGPASMCYAMETSKNAALSPFCWVRFGLVCFGLVWSQCILSVCGNLVYLLWLMRSVRCFFLFSFIRHIIAWHTTQHPPSNSAQPTSFVFSEVMNYIIVQTKPLLPSPSFTYLFRPHFPA